MLFRSKTLDSTGQADSRLEGELGEIDYLLGAGSDRIGALDTTETPDDLYERGAARRRELMGEPSGSVLEPVTQAERDFNRLTTEYYWGSVWTRPGLDLESRSICTLSALTALGREGPLRSHIRGALNIGLTQELIVEVFIHTTFYCGLPFARAAIDLANEIFRES